MAKVVAKRADVVGVAAIEVEITCGQCGHTFVETITPSPQPEATCPGCSTVNMLYDPNHQGCGGCSGDGQCDGGGCGNGDCDGGGCGNGGCDEGDCDNSCDHG